MFWALLNGGVRQVRGGAALNGVLGQLDRQLSVALNLNTHVNYTTPPIGPRNKFRGAKKEVQLIKDE